MSNQNYIDPNLTVEVVLQKLRTFSPLAFDDSRCPLIFQHCDSCCLSVFFFFACLSTCSLCIFIPILVNPLLIQILNPLIPNYFHLIIICELPIDYSLLIQIQIY